MFVDRTRRTTTVQAIWNGATDIARSVVLGGPGPEAISPIATAEWDGLDAAIALLGVAVAAQGEFGGIVGVSKPTRVGD